MAAQSSSLRQANGTSAGRISPPGDASLTHDVKTLQDEVVALQRLAVAGTTSAMLAHEFNNLMTPILARAIDALNRDDPEAMRRALERTVQQVKKAIAMCRHLLRVADPDNESAPRVTRAADAVEAAVEEAIRPFRKDGIELQLAVPGDLWIDTPALLIEQVLLNLLVNARQAMESRRGALRVDGWRADGFVVLRVRDSGCGIGAEELDNVFEPFLRADAASDQTGWRGIGLGLHVCRLIVQERGGAIQVARNEQGGCDFETRWPAAPAPPSV
jgi:C4-dicarboxylate-specific signal transduction histidine kinase